MRIQDQQESTGLCGQAVTFELDETDKLHVLHPGQVIAYRGPAQNRSDKLMNMKGIYRKRKWIRSDFTGPSQLVAAFPPSIGLKTIRLAEESDLLYDFRQLFCYTEGVRMETRILSMKNMMITRDAVKIKFSGEGQIGILTQGQVLELPLHPEEPLYVEAGRVLAYPENAKLELSVYGNHLASQHMRYQWKMTGRGSVLIQSGGAGDLEIVRDLQSDDGIVRRFLREALPFGGVFIK
ncbi:AIM24 family protein [Paenibacillus macerans]|uniref:AIM24 family protein n=1 Tax=Paenibacillus macerans TaxID=44252 RepID=UPI003D31092C